MEKPRKFILLFPNFQQFEIFPVTPHQRSLSLGYLAGMLDKHQIPFQVIDAAARNLPTKEVIENIQRFNPDYVGITTNISIAFAALVTAIHIRAACPNIKIIMGGPWAAAQSEEIIRKKYADIVVLGEGEYTVLDIALTDPGDLESFKLINGICFLTPEGLFSTQPRDQIQDLDELPFPNWEYFPKGKYTRSSRENQMYPFITSRGCPYNCMNCTKIIHGYRMRYRSIENMLEELDYLKKIGAREIAIEDDMFNLDLKRIKKLLIEIIRRNYNFRIQLSNGIRADKVDRLFAKLLYAAGAYHVAVGIESGSQKVVNFLGKGLDLAIVPKTVAILQKEHLKVFGYFILGLPIETYQSLLYSIDFANRTKMDGMDYLTLVLFPGTRLFDYAIQHTNFKAKRLTIGRVLNYQYASMPFTTNELTDRTLKKVKTYYFIRSFVNPLKFFKYVASYNFGEFYRQMIRNIKIFIKRFSVRRTK